VPEGLTRQHLLQVTQRRAVVVEGVQRVHTFNATLIVLATNMGILTIRGRDLHIQHLDLEQGHFTAEGDIDSAVYTQGSGPRDRERLLKKLWG
jgi:sporulation protein YabP